MRVVGVVVVLAVAFDFIAGNNATGDYDFMVVLMMMILAVKKRKRKSKLLL